MRKLMIAIDGPVGSGKSTVARRVAERLGYLYLDSGAMYRALALKALRSDVPLDSAGELERLARGTHIELSMAGGELRVLLDGVDVSEEIRTAETAEAASRVAQHAGVRGVLVAEQRRLGAHGGVVMEGRDIGTVVFPDADLKIYLDASAEARAQRRLRDHEDRGEPIDFESMLEQVRKRDRRDRERTASPLVRAPDAVYVDSTAMDIEEVTRLVVLLVAEREARPAGKHL